MFHETFLKWKIDCLEGFLHLITQKAGKTYLDTKKARCV